MSQDEPPLGGGQGRDSGDIESEGNAILHVVLLLGVVIFLVAIIFEIVVRAQCFKGLKG